MFYQTIKSSQVMESEQKVRKRNASKEKTERTPSSKGTRIIRLPISEQIYSETVKIPSLFRKWIDGLDEKFRLLFDCDWSGGYQLHDIRRSQKMSLSYRRLILEERFMRYSLVLLCLIGAEK